MLGAGSSGIAVALVGEPPGGVEDTLIQGRECGEEALGEVKAAVGGAARALNRIEHEPIKSRKTGRLTSSMIVAPTVFPL